MIRGIKNKKSQAIIKDKVTLAYSELARSFSFILKEEVTVTDMDLFFTARTELANELESSESAVILQTNIMGQYKGTTFLKVKKPGLRRVFASARKSIKGHHGIDKIEVIKEVDNILAASFIARLADSFSIEIYGDVPLLLNEYDGYCLDKVSDGPVVWSDGVVGSSAKAGIVAEFIWIMDENFIQMAEGTMNC